MKIIFLFFFLFSMNLFAVDRSQDEQMRKQLEEVMKARDEMLRSLMDDSNFQDMSKRMEKLMQSFDNDEFFTGANDVVGEYDWKETPTQVILSLKVKQIKDRPLDIKINKGQITIKGDVESQSDDPHNKKISRVHFERSFSIPEGVDQTTPEFENKKGEFLIKFKKKVAKDPKRDLVPVVPSANEQKI